MKKGFISSFIFGAVLLALFVSIGIPARAADPLKVPTYLQPTDEKVLEAVDAIGANPEYVKLTKDYGLNSEGKSPYSRTYIDQERGYGFLEVSQLPMVDAEGDRLKPSWFEYDGKFYTNSGDKEHNNLFWGEVAGTQVTLVVMNDQPTGAKQGDQVTYDPQLFLNGNEIHAPPNPTLLGIDPTAPDYHNNILTWDYGICTRQIKIVEGMFRETWIFNVNPKGDVKIVHNQVGNFPLKLGQYAIDGDVELVPAKAFDDPIDGYPVSVSASATYYPDAHDETTSVDGVTEHEENGVAWSVLVSGAGTAAYDTTTNANCIGWYVAGGIVFHNQRRGIFLFDTSGLPDAVTVTAATLSLYGHSKSDPDGNAPNINIYSSNPASPTALVAGDYDSVGASAFCDTLITYAGFSTSGYNDFAFNAAGKAAISKTGVSEFSSREVTHDVGNFAPTKTQTGWTELKIYWADNGSNKPKLVVTYTTAPDPPTNFDATDTRSGEVRCTWTKSDGATKYQLYRDGTPIGGELGDVATTDDATAGAPTITAGNTVATDGDFTDKVSSSLTGTSTNDGTTYSYTVRAGDDGGWSGDSNADNGHRKPGALGYQWQKSDGDADSGYGNIGGATGATYDDGAAPSPTITPGNTVATDGDFTDKVSLSLSGTSSNDGVGRYYRCTLSATGCAGQSSAANRGHTGHGALSYQWNVDRGGGFGIIGGATGSTYDDTGSPAPSITPGNAVATDGIYTSKVSLSLVGESSDDGATNDYRCSLTATDASEQTSGANTGYRGGGALSYQWQVDRGGGWGNIGGATSATYNDTGSPAPSITPGNAVATDGGYIDKVILSLAGTSSNDGASNNYRCSLTASDASGQTSGDNTGYRGGGSLSYQWQADRGGGFSNIGGATGETYDDTGSPAGTVTPGNASASDGASSSYVTLSLDGESVADGASNDYKCSLTAPDAVGQTSASDTGYRTTGSITYAWQRSAGDSDAGFGVLGGAITDPYNDTTAPADGDGRWYYCEVSATGATTQDSAHDRGHRNNLPSVSTLPAEKDKLFGIVNSGDPIIRRGFVWSLTSYKDPGDVAPEDTAYNHMWAESGIFGLDEFSHLVGDIKGDTNYYGRAFAKNSYGYAYGNEVVFDPVEVGKTMLKNLLRVFVAAAILIGVVRLRGVKTKVAGVFVGMVSFVIIDQLITAVL